MLTVSSQYKLSTLHGLLGLRVGRIKVIFTLSPRISTIAERLAYVEWFRPFREKERATGLYTVSPAIRNHQRVADVVPLERIARSCHLVPKFGTRIEVTQSSTFVDASTFYLNPWIDGHMFYSLRT